jgi:signal transduction histidine kinase
MRFIRSLRYRVALAFALFGGLVSLLLAMGLYIASHNLEERLVDESLTAELEDYIARRTRNSHSVPPATATVHGYVLRMVASGETGRGGDGDADGRAVPDAVRALEPGRHHLDLAGVPHRAAVADHGGNRFYLLYNIELLQRREQYFVAILAAGIIVMALISAAGGLWLAGRVIAPVGELAQRVRGLRPEDRPAPLVQDFGQDELGELAHAFDRYLERLRAFIDRERAFTSDVSHELRTPLAIIHGAAEVVLADETLPERLRERLMRVERAAQEMSELTSALLVMAREEETGARPSTPCDVSTALQDVVDKHRYLLKNKPLEVGIDVQARPSLAADRAVLAIVLGNLIRNAFSHTAGGRIDIRLDPDRVVVRDTGSGIRREELSRVFQRYYRGAGSAGTGIGLSLVKRICDRYGWDVRIASEEGCGTTVELVFGIS